jgi:hypothetical protein
MSESYEQLRDQATGEGAEAWRQADREVGKLRALYATLKEDPRYSEKHKAQQAWKAYEAAKEKIAGGREKAKELLEKQARSAERFSIPVPAEESVTTTDTAKVLASQNEASRIVRKVDRLDSNGKAGPFKPDRLEVLRTEYGRGLETGGVQGGAICRGVLDAAEEFGIDRHSIVEPFRKDRHRESFERAEHVERLAGLIGGEVPEPPFAKPGERKRVPGQYGHGSGVLLLPGRETLAPGTTSRGKRRRAPWK